MTPAEELRAAATRLREMAGEPKPWKTISTSDGPLVLTDHDGGCKWREVATCQQKSEAGWIALMGPDKAGPLAAWLDAEANHKHNVKTPHHRGILGGYHGYCSCGESVIQPDPAVPAECGRLGRALAFARSILHTEGPSS